MQTWQIEKFLNAVEKAGWSIERKTGDWSVLPLAGRPSDPLHVRFVESVSRCVAPDNQVWLLAHDDYRSSGIGTQTIHWDFVYQLAIEAAEGHASWTSEINAFWKLHLPIALNTRGDYGYLALRADGCVVEGFMPDELETSVVASSYAEFLIRSTDALSDRQPSYLSCWFS